MCVLPTVAILFYLNLFVITGSAGHFVVICGFDSAERVIYYKNPASRKGLQCHIMHFSFLANLFPLFCSVLFSL